MVLNMKKVLEELMDNIGAVIAIVIVIFGAIWLGIKEWRDDYNDTIHNANKPTAMIYNAPQNPLNSNSTQMTSISYKLPDNTA